MKVLYISNKPIYPSVDGGCMAMRAFLQCMLAEGLAVKHLCVSTAKHPFKADNYPEDIRQQIHPEAVHIDTDIHFWGAISSFVRRSSYNVDRFEHHVMSELITQTLQAEQFDLVVLESLFVCPYLSLIRKELSGKIFVRTHNVEADIWFDLAAEAKGTMKGPMLKKLARDLKRYEAKALAQADVLLTITEKDRARFDALGIQTASETIPVAVELAADSHAPGSKLFHLGAMDWSPNQQAVANLLRIFPAVRAHCPEAELHIAGRHAHAHLGEIQLKGVHLHDYVEDAAAFMQSCGILVAPINSGSGVRIKILEALAQGLAVITTSKGALGLESIVGEGLLICESDADFAQACVSLIQSEEKRKRLGEAARAYIAQHHSEATIRHKLREVFERK